MIRRLCSLFAILIAVLPIVAGAQVEKPVSIVLVHGAFGGPNFEYAPATPAILDKSRRSRQSRIVTA